MNFNSLLLLPPWHAMRDGGLQLLKKTSPEMSGDESMSSGQNRPCSQRFWAGLLKQIGLHFSGKAFSICDFPLVPKETCLQETPKAKQDLSPIRIKVVGVVLTKLKRRRSVHLAAAWTDCIDCAVTLDASVFSLSSVSVFMHAWVLFFFFFHSAPWSRARAPSDGAENCDSESAGFTWSPVSWAAPVGWRTTAPASSSDCSEAERNNNL